MKNLIVTICIFSLTIFNISAHNAASDKRLITGQVFSEDSEIGIPGVSIKVEGFQLGSITNAEGKFTLMIPKKAEKLVFTLNGFYDEYVLVKDNTNEIEVVMSTAEKENAISRNRIRNKYSGTDSNKLYASLWDDMENDDDWDTFMWLLIDDGYDKFEKQWGIYVENRITLYVENADKQPLSNAEVSLLNRKGEQLWKTYTDFEGKAEMWPDIYDSEFIDKYKASVKYNGKEQNFKSIKAGGGVYHLIFKDNPVEKKVSADIVLTGDLNVKSAQDLSKINLTLKEVCANIASTDEISLSSVCYQKPDPNGVDQDFIKNFEYQNNVSTIDAGFEYALARLVEMYDWSTDKNARVLFWAVDELPSAKYANKNLVRESIKQAAAKGIQIVPVVTTSIDKETEFFLRFVVNATNGEYIFLTDKNNSNYIKPSIGDTKSKSLSLLLENYLKEELGINQLQ